MKHLTIILCAAAALALAGCAPPTRYYNHLGSNSNFDADNAICNGRARAAANAITSQIQCPQQCLTTPVQDSGFGFPVPGTGVVKCHIDSACLSHRAASGGSAYRSTFSACMAERGWAPCGQGGMHLPECQ